MQFNHIVVAPFDETLLRKIEGHRVVVRVDDDDELYRFLDYSRDNKVNLHAVWINSQKPLSSFELSDMIGNLPLALYVPEVGELSEVISKLQLIHSLNLKIFLSSKNKDNYQMLQVLASLNVYCGIYFDDRAVDWEELGDALYYFLYSSSPHAPIEPFQYVREMYDPFKKTDFSSLYFDDPNRFLHLDAAENIALDAASLAQGEVVASGLENLHQVPATDAYNAKINAWQAFFINNESCSSCEAWRICLGKFDGQKDNGCEETLVELMSGVENLRNKEQVRKTIWQY